MRIRVKAFGCKLNQAEAGFIQSGLANIGHEICKNPPYDLIIVCGCTVTRRADYKVRQFIRRMKRKHNVTRIFLSGCSAVSFEEKIIRELGIEKCFLKNDPNSIVEYIGPARTNQGDFMTTFSGRTRGMVKIQDGCNQFCSYCIVPYVRGREVSVPPQTILNRIRQLEKAGVREAVLTGVHDGRYNYDGLDLAGLCDLILMETGIPRIRLSSVEATRISDKLIRIITENSRMMKHLHVPLQSGCDSVLQRMKRHYTARNYLDKVNALAASIEDIAIGADVIVGFPGESDDEFTQTKKTIESAPLAYLHVFRYSMRPGTEAAEMADQVPEEDKRCRMEILQEIDSLKREKFANSQIGKARSVLIEKYKGKIAKGWTDNYLRVEFVSPYDIENKIVLVKPIDYKKNVLHCELEHLA